MNNSVQSINLSTRILLITIACVQNMTMGGVFFGWTSISGTLLTSKHGGPGLSIEEIQFIFVLASFCNSMGPLFLGIILDSYGPRACSVLSILLICLGFFLFSISDSVKNNYFAVSMCLIAFGGPGAQTSIIHLSNLFPKWKATMTAVITGCFQLSFVVFYIFDLLWEEYRWGYASLFKGYCIVCLLNLIASFCLWPDTPLNYDDQMALLHSDEFENIDQLNKKSRTYRLPSVMMHLSDINLLSKSPGKSVDNDYGSTVVPSNNEVAAFFDNVSSPLDQSAIHAAIDIEENYKPRPSALEIVSFGIAQEVAFLTNTENCCMDGSEFLDPMAQSLFKQLTSFAFVRLAIFFVICSFWTNFYIGTMVTQLGDGQVVPFAEISSYGESLTLFMSGAVVFIPLIGGLMDGYGYPITMLVTIFFGIVWSILLATADAYYLYASFLFYAMFRTILYTFLFSYLADKLGFKYYGILAGVLFFVSGLFGLLQYPLSLFAAGACIYPVPATGESCSHGLWTPLNHLMTVMFIALLYFPYQDYQERQVLARVSSFRSVSSYISPSNFSK